MRLRRAIGPAIVVAVIALTVPTHAGGSLESQVFGLINRSRSKALIEHSGLASAARAHSQQMAVSGGLNHDGADERVASAPPDPAEVNGAPDDGFPTAAWCENVTYSTGFPESQVAQKIYEQWHRSAAHNGCMTNPKKNVGAVGIYYDGSTWWATFIAEADSTPPGGAAAEPSRPAQPAQGNATAPRGEPAPASPTYSGAPARAKSLVSPADATVAGSIPLGAIAPSHADQRGRSPTTLDSPALTRQSELAVGRTAIAPLQRTPARDLPVGVPGELVLLTIVALVAVQRVGRRNRTRLSRPVVSIRPNVADTTLDIRAA